MTNIDLLFQQFYRPLCMYALHYLQDIAQVEDMVQDAFVTMIEQEQNGKEINNHKAYLYTTVRNNCLDMIRREQQSVTMIMPQDADGAISDEEAAERSFHEAELWTAIDSLPERCRIIFLMAKRDGKRYREIATELGITEKTVEHQVSKALKILRGKSDDYYYVFLFL
ncbi:MAG: RNA polymerase sigma-70 factor [Prevotella sp.]|nr:RNA polymerase sigma-70 factor [Prevotella sp.]